MSARRKLGLFLVCFAAILLAGSREPPWTDARPIYAVAQSIVTRGAVDTGLWTHYQRDGKYYALQPLIPSLIHVPGAALEKVLMKRYPLAATPIRALTGHLGPAALGALGCLLFALLLLDRGLSARLAITGAGILGGATFFIIYARSPYSEIAQATSFLGFYLYFLRACRWPTPRTAMAFGAFAGAMVNTKVVFILALPGALLLGVLLLLRRHGRTVTLRACGWALVGATPFVVMLLAYNAARTGSPFNNAYPSMSADSMQYGEKIWVGLWGLFLSPGKSLFLYSPPLVAGLIALPRVLADRDRDWAWAAILTAGPVVYLYGRLLAWHGDWCWGPRYIIFVVPLLLLPAMLWLPPLAPRQRRVAGATLGALCALGVGMQVLGGAFYWDHYLRIDHEVRPQWLGQPNRTGSASRDQGGWCDPCLEDLYGLNWLPAFSPISGHAWLLRHVPRDHGWDKALLDAPWTRYTKQPLSALSSYPRVRVDWWFLDFWRERRKPGLALLAFWLALGGLGAFLLRRPGRLRSHLRSDVGP